MFELIYLTMTQKVHVSCHIVCDINQWPRSAQRFVVVVVYLNIL